MSLEKLGTVKAEIHVLMQDLTTKSCNIAKESSNTEDAIAKIMRLVSREINVKTTGFLGNIYTTLKEYTLADPIFSDDNHLNAFYDMELGSKILDSYAFEVTTLDNYSKDKGFNEIKDIYFGVGASVGTLALGTILLAALKTLTVVPFIVLVAGAIAVGLVSYFKVGEIYTKAKFVPIVSAYMKDLETELIKWIDGIENYYNEQVNDLVKTFEV